MSKFVHPSRLKVLVIYEREQCSVEVTFEGLDLQTISFRDMRPRCSKGEAQFEYDEQLRIDLALETIRQVHRARTALGALYSEGAQLAYPKYVN